MKRLAEICCELTTVNACDPVGTSWVQVSLLAKSVTVMEALLVLKTTCRAVVDTVMSAYAPAEPNNRSRHAECRTKRGFLPHLLGFNSLFIRAIFLILKREIKDIL